MKVTLINFTRNALETLIYTKNTRLRMDPTAFTSILQWPLDVKLRELEHMRHTIQSQFEFVDYIFSIEGVSRAFTHQLVRQRVGTSFAQQSQRAVDMAGFEFITGPSIAEYKDRVAVYEAGMETVDSYYKDLCSMGADVQDARGLLPTNVSTNITFKANLRTLHEMAQKRLCIRTQGEYQDVFMQIRSAVINVHFWAEPFLRVWCATHGTCQFHEFPTEQCPVKSVVYNPHSGMAYNGGNPATIDLIQITWEQSRGQNAQPKVCR